MAICSFYQMGRCKFGERCKNEHPGAVTQANRFGSLSGQGRSGSGGGGFGGSFNNAPTADTYNLNAADLRADLTAGKGRPEWIFSSYGPGRNAPVQLMGGPAREQSFEEMRVLHYAAAASGNVQAAIADANRLYAETEAQISTILSDVDGAIKYVVDGSNQHPNRLDIVNGTVLPALNPLGQQQPQQPQQQPNPFNQGQAAPSAFGQPSPLGQPSGFAQPSFGQTSFGQPSPMGQPQPSPFGQAGGFGQTSSFGQPSPMGQPNPLQQPQFGQSGFANQQPNPFGGAAAPPAAGAGGFGQPSPFGAQPGAGAAAAPFGQPQQPQQPTQPNPFGQPQPAAAPGGFGQPSTTTQNPFNALAQPASTTQPSPFGAPGGAGAPPAPSGFGGPAPTGNLPKPTKLSKIPDDFNPNPPLTGETRRDPVTNKLLLWKGQPVQYVDGEPRYQHPSNPTTFLHIFFPDGPPQVEATKGPEGLPEEYNPQVEEAYRHLKQTGKFLNDVVPLVPPKMGWCSYDI